MSTISARLDARLPSVVVELLFFGWKQLQSTVFAASFFAVLALSQVVPLGPLPRYDAILIGALVLQGAMLASRLETRDELGAICLFHLFGFVLEAFKTQPGIASWAYPEAGFSKLLGVPLYSGFMYAAVASYMIQAWRRLDLRLTGAPRPRVAALLATAIYVNFFTHHGLLPDLRWALFALLALAFRSTRVHFTPHRIERRMPLLLAFGLIGLAVWFAENLATALHAWTYPNQQAGWNPVHHGKISSWSLLVVLTFVVVWSLKARKATAAIRATVDRSDRSTVTEA
jgi:uncharacterized membrane protein YoaT (DUF817 family)